MEKYTHNFREARTARGYTMEDVAQSLGVTKGAISSWELSKTQPDIQSLIKLSRLYSVSLEYLVGMSAKMDIPYQKEKDRFLTTESFTMMNRHPAYSKTYGWFLVDALHNEAVFAHRDRIDLGEIKDAVAFSTNLEQYREMYTIKILSYEEMAAQTEIWLEPVAPEGSPELQLKGRYRVKDGFVENDRGIRYFFDTYMGTWYAFHVSEATDKQSLECRELYIRAYDEGYEDGLSAGEQLIRQEFEDFE